MEEESNRSLSLFEDSIDEEVFFVPAIHAERQTKLNCENHGLDVSGHRIPNFNSNFIATSIGMMSNELRNENQNSNHGDYRCASKDSSDEFFSPPSSFKEFLSFQDSLELHEDSILGEGLKNNAQLQSPNNFNGEAQLKHCSNEVLYDSLEDICSLVSNIEKCSISEKQSFEDLSENIESIFMNSIDDFKNVNNRRGARCAINSNLTFDEDSLSAVDIKLYEDSLDDSNLSPYLKGFSNATKNSSCNILDTIEHAKNYKDSSVNFGKANDCKITVERNLFKSVDVVSDNLIMISSLNGNTNCKSEDRHASSSSISENALYSDSLNDCKSCINSSIKVLPELSEDVCAHNKALIGDANLKFNNFNLKENDEIPPDSDNKFSDFTPQVLLKSHNSSTVNDEQLFYKRILPSDLPLLEFSSVISPESNNTADKDNEFTLDADSVKNICSEADCSAVNYCDEGSVQYKCKELEQSFNEKCCLTVKDTCEIDMKDKTSNYPNNMDLFSEKHEVRNVNTIDTASSKITSFPISYCVSAISTVESNAENIKIETSNDCNVVQKFNNCSAAINITKGNHLLSPEVLQRGVSAKKSLSLKHGKSKSKNLCEIIYSARSLEKGASDMKKQLKLCKNKSDVDHNYPKDTHKNEELQKFHPFPKSPQKSCLSTNDKINFQPKEKSLFDALDLHDVSLNVDEDIFVQSKDSLIPLNLCLKDLFCREKVDISRQLKSESKENLPVSKDHSDKARFLSSPKVKKCPQSSEKITERKAVMKKNINSSTPTFVKPTKIPISQQKSLSKFSATSPKYPKSSQQLSERSTKSPILMKCKASANVGPEPSFARVPSVKKTCSSSETAIKSKLPKSTQRIATPKKYWNVSSPVSKYINETPIAPLFKVIKPVKRPLHFPGKINKPFQEDFKNPFTDAEISSRPLIPVVVYKPSIPKATFTKTEASPSKTVSRTNQALTRNLCPTPVVHHYNGPSAIIPNCDYLANDNSFMDTSMFLPDGQKLYSQHSTLATGGKQKSKVTKEL